MTAGWNLSNTPTATDMPAPSRMAGGGTYSPAAFVKLILNRSRSRW